VVGVAQAVPGAGLSFAEAQVPHQHQRVLAEDQGLVILTELSVGPADAVERDSLSARVAGEAEFVESLASILEGVREAALLRGNFGHPYVDICLAAEIADCRVDRQSLPVAGFGLIQAVQPLARLGQAEQRRSQPAQVTVTAAASAAARSVTTCSCQYPPRNRYVFTVHASCQACRSRPAAADALMQARST
jgi:hypothetical protein